MIVTCARCGHVAGAMCPHCGNKERSIIIPIVGESEPDYYCGEIGGCYWRQIADIENDEFDEDQISCLSPPMTPEEEEMLAEDADMGIGTED